MIHKVEKFIQEKRLLHEGCKIIVALSGGADSVALLLVLQKLGYSCTALHCNFHLRGEESNRDEQFVKKLCEKLNTPLKIVNFNTTEYAAEKKISIEMAAREQRYEAFEECRATEGANAIAVAHHRDDSAETLLLNLMRGTGIKGLRGIQPKNGYIVRPLLCVGREEILDYLKWRGAEYVTDSTNLTTDFTRNKIRLEILPMMSKINPSIIDSIAQTAEHLAETEKVYAETIEEGIKRVKKEGTIDVAKLQQEPSPQALLFEILHPLGFNSTQTKNITDTLDAEGSRTFDSKEWVVTKDRNKLIISRKADASFAPTALPINGTVETPYGTIKCSTSPFDGQIERSRNCATLDADKVQPPLAIRLWQQGDRFTPFGMRGSKLVSDYMTDRKMSLAEKACQLVVTDASGEIVWLVGERLSDKCRTSEKTTTILQARWLKK